MREMLDTVSRFIKTLIKLVLGRGVRTSYGQHGEDAAIQALLKWVHHGTYVDLGAYHPTLYSNTYALYRQGWSGIVIDPNSDFKPLYTLLRPRDTFVHAAVGKERGERMYYVLTDESYNSFDEERARGWKSLRGVDIVKSYPVSFKPLSDIIKEQEITHIDLLNIDVEGLDFEALKTHDWSVLPRVIAIEDDSFDADAPHESEIYTFLHAKGYQLNSMAGNTLLFALPKQA